MLTSAVALVAFRLQQASNVLSLLQANGLLLKDSTSWLPSPTAMVMQSSSMSGGGATMSLSIINRLSHLRRHNSFHWCTSNQAMSSILLARERISLMHLMVMDGWFKQLTQAS